MLETYWSKLELVLFINLLLLSGNQKIGTTESIRSFSETQIGCLFFLVGLRNQTVCLKCTRIFHDHSPTSDSKKKLLL